MSHNSKRSLRTKQQARKQPDAVWLEDGQLKSERFDSQSAAVTAVLSGGSQLAQYIAHADAVMQAMRNTCNSV